MFFARRAQVLVAKRIRSSRRPTVPRDFQGPHISHSNFASIELKDRSVEVPSLSATFPFVWLRDSCQCPACVHPSTQQKLHKSSDVSLEIHPSQIIVTSSPDEMVIRWSDGHTSTFTRSFFETYRSTDAVQQFHRNITKTGWKSELFGSLSKEQILIPYAQLADPNVRLALYDDLARYGLVFLRDVPIEETADEKCELRRLANSLGEIRNTFYGQTWDVRNVRDSKNIAYTNLDLGLHMDLLYFKEPPRYQILHCIRNRVRGGESIFVDGLQAAEQLLSESPEDAKLLASAKVNYHYINDGHHLHWSHPVFDLEEGTEKDTFRISSINYSPPFQAPLPVDTPLAFYSALANYADILNEPGNVYRHLLREGEVIIFDNRRVLHGRAAFESKEDPCQKGETDRWLKGCYLEEDAVLDKARVLRTQVNGENLGVENGWLPRHS